MKGFTLWIGGAELAGLAAEVEGLLLERGLAVERLDEEDRGFHPPPRGEQRADHLRRLARVCLLLARNGVAAVVSAVTPLGRLREELRPGLDPFLEVLSAGDGECGEAAVTVPPGEGVEAGAGRVLRVLERLAWVPSLPGAAYSPSEEREIEDRLRDLGYM